MHANHKVGMTFARALRSILRQDPDVIMVGEIRDAETADIAVKSALTGHLVLSSVHANDAPGTVTRLIDMGVPRYLVGSAVALVMAQRLVRRVCERCKESYIADPEQLASLGDDAALLARPPPVARPRLHGLQADRLPGPHRAVRGARASRAACAAWCSTGSTRTRSSSTPSATGW